MQINDDRKIGSVFGMSNTIWRDLYQRPLHNI